MKDIPVITADYVRALYPYPRACSLEDSCEKAAYCVMGALSRALPEQRDLTFPSPDVSFELLQAGNPRLNTETTEIYVGTIIASNDRGQFEDAWFLLDRALSWGTE